MDEIIWKDWCFRVAEEYPIFGKTKIEATKDELEEVFYVYCEELTEDICEDLYNDYLYVYE